jgi:nucleolar protein 58
MSLGLSHSLSRHKLKFSPDKIDTMIVQAVALLDDLDKELNTYAMRVKEWYGWHFPELGKILNDNVAYARVICKMGMRSNAAKVDLAEILPEEIEVAVKQAAEMSMGTEITSEDLDNIQALAEQVVDFTEYRQTLSSYLSARMRALAPNLTALVGELVGARLISHAGSLLNLAKSPASTIQILGAEKALFRALKTKHDTPKYGLIYHASLVGQATGKNKGRIARVLAAKAALGLRVDAYANWGVQGDEETDIIPEDEKAALGLEARSKIERRLAAMEGKPVRVKGTATIAPVAPQQQPSKWDVKEARKYNKDADGLDGDEPAQKDVSPPKSLPTRNSKSVKRKRDSDDSSDEEKVSVPTIKASVHNGVAPSSQTLRESTPNGKHGDGEHSDTISTVSVDTPDSPDSPTPQELNWQSSIEGNTKEAKRARKAERKERRAALAPEKAEKKQQRDEKIARRLARKERRIAKEQQALRRADRSVDPVAEMAAKAGLSVTRYKRKLERGEIRIEADGTPVAISKKEIKKAAKKAEKLAAMTGEVKENKKRKHEGDEDKAERKKKKKEKKEKA